ncbi:hypothetical protein EDD18DRAFT_1113332 [Armillaria luteobubalina]|uniref:Uncharacterized protein n=1 Tax=Armillaria luteobubalina TaxID=153913 RepID=A0AA39PB79_9AGAR|nr:hypothetical protein EDD18DRAFT_1113332 [Armillaria luteobubalina]
MSTLLQAFSSIAVVTKTIIMGDVFAYHDESSHLCFIAAVISSDIGVLIIVIFTLRTRHYWLELVLGEEAQLDSIALVEGANAMESNVWQSQHLLKRWSTSMWRVEEYQSSGNAVACVMTLLRNIGIEKA